MNTTPDMTSPTQRRHDEILGRLDALIDAVTPGDKQPGPEPTGEHHLHVTACQRRNCEYVHVPSEQPVDIPDDMPTVHGPETGERVTWTESDPEAPGIRDDHGGIITHIVCGVCGERPDSLLGHVGCGASAPDHLHIERAQAIEHAEERGETTRQALLKAEAEVERLTRERDEAVERAERQQRRRDEETRRADSNWRNGEVG